MKKALIIGNGMMGGSLGMAHTKTGKYIVDFVDKNQDLSSVQILRHFCVGNAFQNFFNRSKECNANTKYDYIFNCTGHKFDAEQLIKETAICIDIGSIQYNNTHNSLIFCHPLCGSEKSGRENARADLFENQTCIITTEGKSQELIDLAIEVFNDIGMIVHLCDTVEEHNRNLAYTSHLLHYLAFNGFADLHPVLERLSHSNKEMWEGIFKANKKNIDEALLKFTYNLALCFHNQGIQASIRELVKDIPEHFYGTALKQLLK